MSKRPLTYVYQCWAYNGRLLYVGITSDLSRRKQEHAQDKFWWQEVANVTSRAFSREIEARWAEWALIVTHRPPYNSSSPVPKTPDVTLAEPVVVHEIVHESFPQYVHRLSRPAWRWWRSIPTGYAVLFGVNAAIIPFATWVYHAYGRLGG